MLTVKRAMGITAAATATALTGVLVAFSVGLSTALSNTCTDTGPANCGANNDTETLIVMVVVWAIALAVIGLVVRAALGDAARSHVGVWRITVLAAAWIPLPALLFGVGWSVDHSANTSFATAVICAIAVGLVGAVAWCVLLIELCGGRASPRLTEAA